MTEHIAGKKEIMVCVTGQKTCDRLIARGEELRGGDSDTVLHVVHCVQTGRNFLGNPYEGEALEYLFTAAQLCGADLSMLRAENVDDALVEFAKDHSVDVIVMGAPSHPGESILTRLERRLPDVAFDVVE